MAGQQRPETITIQSVTYKHYQNAPTKEEIIACLKRNNFMEMGLPKKRQLIADVVVQKPAIQGILSRCRNPDNLLARLNGILPIDAAKAKDATINKSERVANMYYELHKFWDTVKNEAKLTRADKPIIKLFQPFQDAVLTAESKAKEEKEGAVKSAIVSLSAMELNRGYLEDGTKPRDEALSICLLCGHGFVDEPNKNKLVLQENRLLTQKHNAAMVQHKQDKAAGKLAAGKRAPKLVLKPLIVKCHCKRMICMRGGGNGTCLLCPNGPQGGGNICTCVVCQCQCEAAIDISKTHLANQLSMEQIDREAIERQRRDQAQMSATWAAQQIDQQVAMAMAAHVRHQKQYRLPINLDHVREDGIEAAAKNLMVEAHHDSVHQPWLAEYANSLGPPSHQVKGLYNDVLDSKRFGGSLPKRQKLNGLDPDKCELLRDEAKGDSGYDCEETQLAAQMSYDEINMNKKPPAKKPAPKKTNSVYPYGKDGKERPNGFPKATPHNAPVSCLRSVPMMPSGSGISTMPLRQVVRTEFASQPVRRVGRSVSPIPSMDGRISPMTAATSRSANSRRSSMQTAAVSMPETIDLVDSSPESISDPVIPRPRTPDDLFQEVKRHALATSGVVSLDGAQLSEAESSARELARTAYLQMSNMDAAGYPAVSQDASIDFFGNLLLLKPTIIAQDALAAFMGTFTHKSAPF